MHSLNNPKDGVHRRDTKTEQQVFIEISLGGAIDLLQRGLIPEIGIFEDPGKSAVLAFFPFSIHQIGYHFIRCKASGKVGFQSCRADNPPVFSRGCS